MAILNTVKNIANWMPRVRGVLHTIFHAYSYRHLGVNLKIYPNCGIFHKDKIYFSDNVTVSFGCFISPLDLFVGDNVWLGNNNFICGKVSIGNNVSLGPNVIIPGANHDVTANKHVPMGGTLVVLGTVIEDDCWIGGNVSILDGVTIGRGAVVGAGAVITNSVPPYSIVVGNPARVIKKRH